jgi:kinesin family protein 2/24
LPNILAPRETGAQLLNLTNIEFEYRCQKCPGVKQEQAQAFRLRLWQMHIDSQHNEQKPKSVGNFALFPEGSNSSRDLDPTRSKLPFKDRFRPGMVVGFSIPQNHEAAHGLPEGRKLAVLLCPAEAFSGSAKEYGEHTALDGRRYSCALLVPGQTDDAYELNLWRQIVIDVDSMDTEVHVEYDSATRYYYVSV